MNVPIKPIISEKSMTLTENSWFTFAAPLSISKREFAAYIKEKYGAKPLAINSLTTKKEQRRRGKHFFMTQATKKFRVKMPKNTKISAFEVTK
jgi:ribosomal protein L23